MAVTVTGVLRGPGEIAAMTIDVIKAIFTTPFQFREFIEQAWFITSVTLMPTILVSIPFGAVISLQVGSLTGQLGAQSFAGATAVLAVVREAAPIAAALITLPGLSLLPAVPHTGMVHVHGALDAEEANRRAAQVAEALGLRPFGRALPGLLPGTFRTELALGEAALQVSVDEAREAWRRVIAP